MSNPFVDEMMSRTAQDHTSFAWGTTWMLLSATMLSCSFSMLKLNLEYFSYFFAIFLRFFMPFIILTGIVLLGWRWQEITAKGFGLQLARAGCVLVSQYSFAYFVMNNTLLNATMLLNASPLFIPLIEWIFLRRRPGQSTILAALVSFIGVILVLQPDKTLFTAMSAIGILAALGQSGSQVLYGLKSKTESALNSLYYLFGLTALSSFIAFIFIEKETEIFRDIKLTEGFLGLYLILMAITTLLNQYYRGLAYRCSTPSALSPFLYFSVFVSALLDWVIFKNIPTTLSIIGAILIISGGLLKIFLRAHILKKKDSKL